MFAQEGRGDNSKFSEVIRLLLGTLDGLSEAELAAIRAAAVEGQAPLTLALAIEKTRQLAMVQERLPWRESAVGEQQKPYCLMLVV